MLTSLRVLSVMIIAAGATGGTVFDAAAATVERLPIGIGTGGTVIDAFYIAAGDADSPLVALVGGFEGDDSSSNAIRAELDDYASRADALREVAVIAVPVVNPDAVPLVFPPTGAAYRENPEAHTLWRWIGLNAPDRVLIAGAGSGNLADVLADSDVAGVGRVPAVVLDTVQGSLQSLSSVVPRSPAGATMATRRSRSPDDLATLLRPIYGTSFDAPIYIFGMGLIAQLGLGELEAVRTLVEPYVDGRRDSLAAERGGTVSTLVLAGHLVFAELARRTGDTRYLERARAAADTSFGADGALLEAVPNHGEMSDAIFMGASILAAVGSLTGERRYFDMAVRQIDFMNRLVRRDDGLYRHSPMTDAAWGRGNGFAAIGYALTLSTLSTDHPDYARLADEYESYMRVLATWQNADGSFSQVIDYPAAYHETSSTAIIGFSMQRGIHLGLLDAVEFEPVVAAAFTAVSRRTGEDGSFIDVSESTNKQPSLEAYLNREALFGRDARTGSFALLFAVERGAGAL